MMGSYQKQGAVLGVTLFMLSSLVYDGATQQWTVSISLSGIQKASSNKTFLIDIVLLLNSRFMLKLKNSLFSSFCCDNT